MLLSTLKPSSGGINNLMKGPGYQKEFLVLFACNATYADLDFELSTEIPQAGKFDDLVFVYHDSDGKPHVRLLQAKHRANPVDMDLNSLLVDIDFCLHKYFVSFKTIMPNFKEVDDVILATSNRFKNLGDDNIVLKVRNKDISISTNLIQIHNNDHCLGNIQHCYKFENSTVNFDFLKNYLLAYELATSIFADDPSKLNEENCSVLLHYRKFVENNIIDLSSKCFKIDFFDKSNTSLKELKKIFPIVIDEMCSIKNSQIRKKFEKSHYKTIWKYIQEKSEECSLNLLDLFKDQADEDVLPDREIQMDRSIKEFLEKFMFLMNADMNSIENATITCLKEKFKFEDYNSYLGNLETNITKWITDEVKIQKPIDRTFVQKSFCGTVAISIRDLLAEKFKILKDLEFTYNLDWIDDLTKEVGIKVLLTSEEDSLLSCWKICQRINESGKLLMFLQSDETTDILNKAVRTFESCVDYCLLNVISNSYTVPKDLIRIGEISSKRLIIVAHRDHEELQNYNPENILPTLWKDLTQDSKSKIIQRGIKFQNYKIQLKNLIDDFPENQKVWQILGSDSIAANTFINNFDSNMYVERKIQYKINLNWELLKDVEENKISDHIAFNEGDFNKFCKEYPNQNIHWLIKNDQIKELLWRKTHRSFSNLRKYFYTTNRNNLNEDKFLLLTHSKTNIIVDSAGMGKTWLIQSMAKKMKERHKDHWIIKVDLNSFTQCFDKKGDLLISSLKFIRDDVLKLTEDFDKILFDHACVSSGRIIIFFDGFDEVARSYKDIVVPIIKYWVQNTNVRCFIATRPEWRELLEDEFSTTSFSLMAFTEEDKKDYLTRKWKNGFEFTLIELDLVIKNILENFSSQISQKEKSFTGTPLIMKLLSEYFEDKIKQAKLQYENVLELICHLNTQNYNLLDLYKAFVQNMIERQLEEKQSVDLSKHGNFEILEKTHIDLNELHQRFAIRHIFDKNVTKKLPNQMIKPLEENEITKLVDCGIITKDNDEFIFLHFTFIEYFVVGALINNLKDKHVVTLLLEEVLSKEEGYEVIQMFVNHSFSLLKNQPNKKVSRNISKTMLRKEELAVAFHIACTQNNINSFEFLFNSVLENSNGILKKQKSKKLLEYKWKNNLIFNLYFEYCESSVEILEKIKLVFGLKFVEEILLAQSQNYYNVVIASFKHDNINNCIKLLEWILKNFCKNPIFLESILSSEDYNGNGIFHFAIENYSLEAFPQFLDILKRSKSLVGEKFIRDIIMHQNNKGETILHLKQFRNANLNFTEIFEFMKIEIDDLDNLKSILFSVDDLKKSILHNLFYNCAPKKLLNPFIDIFNFIKTEFGVETVKYFLLIEDDYGHYFFKRISDNYGMRNNFILQFNVIIETYNFIKVEVGSEFMREIFINYNVLEGLYEKWNSQQEETKSIFDLISWIQIEFGNKVDDEIFNNLINVYWENYFDYISNEKYLEDNNSLLMNFLNESKSSDKEILKKFVFASSGFGNSLLSNYIHYFCFKKDFFIIFIEILNCIQNEFDKESVDEMFLTKDYDGRNLLNCLLSEYQVPSKAIINFLDLLKQYFANKIEIFQTIISSKMTNGNSFLNYYILMWFKYYSPDNSKLIIFIQDIINWVISNLDHKLTSELILNQNNKKENFMHLLIIDYSFEINEKELNLIFELIEIIKDKVNDSVAKTLLTSENQNSMTVIQLMKSNIKSYNNEVLMEKFNIWIKTNKEILPDEFQPIEIFSNENLSDENLLNEISPNEFQLIDNLSHETSLDEKFSHKAIPSNERSCCEIS